MAFTVNAYTAASGNFTATGTSACFVGSGGGGGGGGVSAGASAAGSAGGGGGAKEQILFVDNLVNGRQYDYVVGGGGSAGANTGANGGSGGDTTVTDHISAVVIFRAPGASGGAGSTSTTAVRGGQSITAQGGAGTVNLSTGTSPTAGAPGNQYGGDTAVAGWDSGLFFGGTGSLNKGGGGGAGPRGPGGNSGATASPGVAAPVANSGAGGGGATGNGSTANIGGAGAAGYLDVYQYP